jgi:5-methylthioadenosine/S-adenosylhomocysteine deaminase
MLRLATLDGARVWGLDDEIGSLTPGKQADIAIVDMRSAHLDGFGDPVAFMVLGAGPADVETVIVGGEVVKRDGQLVGAHIKRAHDLMHETQDRLRSTDTPETSRFSESRATAPSSPRTSREAVTR